MALLAGDARMLPFQGKTGLLVIEFAIESRWAGRPAFRRVAITASNFDFAVRIIGRSNLGRRVLSQQQTRPQQNVKRKT